MANALFDKGRNHFAMGDILWKATGGSVIRAFLVDSLDYTADLANHEFLSSVPVLGRVGGTAGGTAYNSGIQLTLIDPVAGVCDANDITFPAVTGDQSEYILIYKMGTSDADSILIALIDTATGIPVTPSGGDIIVTWDNGANKIFKL